MSWFGRSTSQRFIEPTTQTPGPGHYNLPAGKSVGEGVSSVPFSRGRRFQSPPPAAEVRVGQGLMTPLSIKRRRRMHYRPNGTGQRYIYSDLERDGRRRRKELRSSAIRQCVFSASAPGEDVVEGVPRELLDSMNSTLQDLEASSQASAPEPPNEDDDTDVSGRFFEELQHRQIQFERLLLENQTLHQQLDSFSHSSGVVLGSSVESYHDLKRETYELECNLSSVCSANAVLGRKLANASEATQALYKEKEQSVTAARAETASVRSQLASLKASLRQKQELLTQANLDISAKEKQTRQINSHVASLECENAELKQIEQKQLEKIANFESSLSDLSQELSLQRECNARQRHELESLEVVVESSRRLQHTQQQELENALRSSAESVQSQQRQLELLRSQNLSQQQHLDQASITSKDKEQQLELLRSQHLSQKHELEQACVSLQDNQRQLELVRADLEQARNSAESKGQQLDLLHAELEQTRNVAESKQQQLVLVRSQHCSQQQELEQARASELQHQQQIQTTQARLQLLNTENERLQRHNLQLEVSLGEAEEADSILRQDLDGALQSLEEATQEAQASQQLLEELEESLKQKEAEMLLLRESLEQASTSLKTESGQSRNLRSQLQTLEKDLAALLNEKQSLEETLQNREMEHNTLRDEILHFQEGLSCESARVSALQREKEQAERRVLDLENQLDTLQSRSNETEITLNNQYSHLLQEHQELQAGNVCLQEELAALTLDQDAQLRDLALAHAELEALKKSSMEVQDEVQRLADDNQRLESLYTEKSAVEGELRSELSCTEEALREQRLSSSELQRKLLLLNRTMEQENQRQQGIVRSLQAELNDVSTRFAYNQQFASASECDRVFGDFLAALEAAHAAQAQQRAQLSQLHRTNEALQQQVDAVCREVSYANGLRLTTSTSLEEKWEDSHLPQEHLLHSTLQINRELLLQNQALAQQHQQIHFVLKQRNAEYSLTEKESLALHRKAAELENINASIVGHGNLDQRIHLHEKIKRENEQLRSSVRGLERKLVRCVHALQANGLSVSHLQVPNKMQQGKENNEFACSSGSGSGSGRAGAGPKSVGQVSHRSRSLSRSRIAALHRML